MPALNIEYTEQELAAVPVVAAADGKTVKQDVHDASLREQQQRVFTATAAKVQHERLGEFDAAFLDEAPTRRAKDEVA